MRLPRIFAACSTLLLLLPFGLPAAAGAEESAAADPSPAAPPAPLPDADEFYARARARHAPMFAKFVGTETKSVQEVVRRSAKTGEVRARSKVVLTVRDHYYLPREIRVHEYWEEGEKLDPDDYTDRSGKEPRHPLLDANGPKEYAVELLGREEKNGRSCLVLRFIPRKKTTRHLMGKTWFDEENLDLVAVEVRPAKMPFGVKQISAQVSFRQAGDVMLSTGSVTRVLVHVPIVFPNNLLVIREEVLSARGLPRK